MDKISKRSLELSDLVSDASRSNEKAREIHNVIDELFYTNNNESKSLKAYSFDRMEILLEIAGDYQMLVEKKLEEASELANELHRKIVKAEEA